MKMGESLYKVQAAEAQPAGQQAGGRGAAGGQAGGDPDKVVDAELRRSVRTEESG